METGPALELLVDADLQSLERTRLRVLAHLSQVPGFSQSIAIVYAVELVLEEWLTNVFKHGTRSPVGLRVAVRRDVITLRFDDDGPPFDPTGHRQAPRPASLDEAVPGGLGLFLIQHYARSCRYAREEGRNVMTVAIDAPPS